MSLIVHIKKKLRSFSLQADFEAEDGVLALLGPSGCGKSMTLKCIAGIEKPDEGIISLSGRVLFDSSKKLNLPPQKRKVGYMFQSYALFPNMTVRKNVLAGMGKKPDPSLADPFLERFRIRVSMKGRTRMLSTISRKLTSTHSIKPAPTARPMHAEAQRPAAVVSPVTSCFPVTMMVPAARKPTPPTTCVPRRTTSVRCPTTA